MTLVTFFLVLIFAISLYLLITPIALNNAIAASELNNGLEDLNFRKKEILESLKEFELDKNMEKISHEDFQSLYQETFVEGTRLLKEIESREIVSPENVNPENLESPKVISKGITQVTPKFCSQCGTLLETQAKFCSQCGHKIQRSL